MSRVTHPKPFPFCPATEFPPLGRDNYPLAFSLKQAMKMYWRVRKWKFTFTLYSPDESETQTVERGISKYSSIATGDPYSKPEYQYETSLVCRSEVPARVNVGPPPEDEKSFFLFDYNADFPQFVKQGDDYYPFMILNVGGGSAPKEDFSRDGYKITAQFDLDGSGYIATMEPVLWWAYAHRNGKDPLFDTSSGDSLA